MFVDEVSWSLKQAPANRDFKNRMYFEKRVQRCPLVWSWTPVDAKDPCAAESFEAAQLLHVWAGRTLIFLGDSLSKMFLHDNFESLDRAGLNVSVATEFERFDSIVFSNSLFQCRPFQ
jgi:hypothetical protein